MLKAIARTAEATKISEITICRISKCGKESEEQFESRDFQVKKRKRENRMQILMISTTILNYYERKEVPTLDKVMLDMKENSL